MSTQFESLQHASPPGHPFWKQPGGGGGRQAPFTQLASEPQLIPQPPQLLGSLDVSMHPPPQQISWKPHPVVAHVGFGDAHWPPAQKSPGGQTFPQAPQFEGSLNVFALHGPPSFPSPPSVTTHCSVVGSHLVPAGQGSSAQDVPSTGPSSPCSEAREHPASRTRARARKANAKKAWVVAPEGTRDRGMGRALLKKRGGAQRR